MQPATFPVGIPLVSPMPVAAAPVLVLGLPLPLPPLLRSLTSPAPTPPSNLTLTEPSISPLPEPTQASLTSPEARRLLGDDVVDHYGHFFAMECAAFDAAVTDWEHRRYFERI